MKLSDIRQIDEGRKIIDDEYTPGKKLLVIDNPGVNTTISFLEQINDQIGGWITPNGSYIWDRDRASHFYISQVFNIDRNKSGSFYLSAAEKDGKQVIEAILIDSGTGGLRESEMLDHPLIRTVMDVLAKRREQLNKVDNDDFSDLLGSLNGSDY